MESEKSSLCSGNKFKHDWYQTDTHVIINIFVKNTVQENVNIDYKDKDVDITVKLPPSSEYVANFELLHNINPNECSFKLYSTKIEIKLKKKEGYRWDRLEGDGTEDQIHHIPNSVVSPTTKAQEYPSSSAKKHDWSKIEADVKRSEEEEKPEGDAALNQLFQKIYCEGGDEVKKAMNKSFSESGGTVLSTNWKEIRESEVDVKAPDGMEWKKWEK